MSRLPIVNSDDGTWGTILNDYLSVSINSDGTLNPVATSTALNHVTVKSSNYTTASTQSECILGNAAGGAITITLPTAASNTNVYTVKKIDASVNTVTIATTASQTVDGGATAVLRVRYASVNLVSDGSNWFVV